VANHGKGEPGLGVRTDGTALSLAEMAGECLFDTTEQLTGFLDYAAGLGHVHEAVWQQKRIVFIPAMWERISAYYRSKARKMNYATSQEVIAAVLAGTIRPTVAHSGDDPALQTNKQTNNTNQHHQKNIGTTLLDDGGPDQAEAVMALWNAERQPGPHVTKLPKGRRTRILKVLKDYPNLEDWRIVIRYINRQRWCNAPGSGDFPNFRMDLDGILKPGKFQKLFENQRMERPVAAGGQTGRDVSRGRTGAKPGKFAAALDPTADDVSG
jgi:hypothetical protein